MKSLSKLKKSLFIGLVVLISVTACHDTNIYRGEEPALHSVALESIIGTYSYEMNKVIRLEEDEYGRVLFAFYGGYMYSELGGMHVLAVIIAQRIDENKAYFYDSENVQVITIDSISRPINSSVVNEYFNASDVDLLKQKNDWGKPIDETKLFSVVVSRKKSCEVSTQDINRIKDNFEGNPDYGFLQCFGPDRNGNTLVSLLTRVSSGVDSQLIYLVIINDKKEIISSEAVLQIDDVFNHDLIKEFKAENDWNHK